MKKVNDPHASLSTTGGQTAAGAGATGGTGEKEGGGSKKDDKLPKFEPWTKKIPGFQMPVDTPLQVWNNLSEEEVNFIG